ncbi:hypothetical protein F5141DRAFT_73321 [Pisolithus sp. B1]|nr:hypothetical protein F5141DRAFT_73321 [Pisolithus sp. B1]
MYPVQYQYDLLCTHFMWMVVMARFCIYPISRERACSLDGGYIHVLCIISGFAPVLLFPFTTASSCWPCEEYKEEQEEEKPPRSERSVILWHVFFFLLNLACPTPRVPATLLIYSAPFGGHSVRPAGG